MRSIYGGTLNKDQLDQEVTLCGWVDRRRDHGGVIFIDLRDREGIVQVVFDPDAQDKFELADKVRSEYVRSGNRQSARAFRCDCEPQYVDR